MYCSSHYNYENLIKSLLRNITYLSLQVDVAGIEPASLKTSIMMSTCLGIVISEYSKLSDLSESGCLQPSDKFIWVSHPYPNYRSHYYLVCRAVIPLPTKRLVRNSFLHLKSLVNFYSSLLTNYSMQ